MVKRVRADTCICLGQGGVPSGVHLTHRHVFLQQLSTGWLRCEQATWAKWCFGSCPTLLCRVQKLYLLVWQPQQRSLSKLEGPACSLPVTSRGRNINAQSYHHCWFPQGHTAGAQLDRRRSSSLHLDWLAQVLSLHTAGALPTD